MEPITWAAAWAVAKKFALPVALVVSVLAGWHFQSRAEYWHQQDVQCGVDRKADRAAFKKAAADATAKNKQEVADTVTKWKGVVTTTENEYETKLADARASVAAYAKRLRDAQSQADTGSSGAGGVSSSTDTTVTVDGPGEGALVPVPVGDLNVCAENTVKAQSWQSFWNGFVEGYPKNGQH